MPAVLKRERGEFWSACYAAAQQLEAEDAKPSKLIPRVAKMLDVDQSTAWRYRQRWGLPDEVREEVAQLADNPDGDAPEATEAYNDPTIADAEVDRLLDRGEPS